MTNYTDKELLELAAKAAGYDIKWSNTFERFERFENDFYKGAFNPLNDDGDALRLAVGLKLDIVCCLEVVSVWRINNEDSDEAYGTDPYAATRRAIVRAAAAIGSKL